jgi:hypothetical protein
MLTPRQLAVASIAGPNNWWHLIRNDHTEMRPEGAIPILATPLNGGNAEPTIEQAVITLSSFAGASLILANAAASQSIYTAREVFLAAKKTAEDLDSYAPTAHPATGNERAWWAAVKILQSESGDAFLWLLVDIIRIANHIAGEKP